MSTTSFLFRTFSTKQMGKNNTTNVQKKRKIKKKTNAHNLQKLTINLVGFKHFLVHQSVPREILNKIIHQPMQA
uniref:Uncharacterized protein n=1 Tax=Rhizophora mucronata TaxID=61149 RepID=A0A2P2MZF7_RHIMU